MSRWNPSTWFDRGNPIDPYVQDFIDAMEYEDLPVKISEVKRSRARQLELYAQGRTKPGAVVTWTTRSKHLSGEAFDFDFIYAEDNRDPEAWGIAGEVLAGMGLVWGGEWRVQDLRHAELSPGEAEPLEGGDTA